MKKHRGLGSQAMALLLAGAMMIASVGCNKSPTTPGTTSTSTMNAATVKVVLQGVITAAQVAFGFLAPGAAPEISKFTTDANGIIANWQVGASWKQNVLALIPTLATDAANLVPKCADSAKCQLVVNDLVAGLTTVETDLKGPGTWLSPKHWFGKRPKTYDNFDAFRQDWNRDAPANAQLPTVAEMSLNAAPVPVKLSCPWRAPGHKPRAPHIETHNDRTEGEH